MLNYRKIERHPSGKGCVIPIDMFGKKLDLFVADAKYRAILPMSKLVTQTFDLNKVTFEEKRINPQGLPDLSWKPLPYNLTDIQIQQSFSALLLDKTAKENTLALKKDFKAVKKCRRLNFKGLGKMELPNLFEAIILYLESDRIDALDPTVKDYPFFSLGVHGRKERLDCGYKAYGVWSSTFTFNTKAYRVLPTGDVEKSILTSRSLVAPVKEINKL